MDVVTIGETMTLFTPNEEGPLRHANSFSMKFGGAESNVAIGLSRLGHRSRWISRLGGSLINPAKLVSDEDYAELTETAKKFSAIVQNS